MTQPTYLAIDIGNVICNMRFDEFLFELGSMLGITLRQATDLLYKIQKSQDIGILTVREELGFVHGLNHTDIEYLIQAWNETLVPDPDVVGALLDLHSQGTQIALLSNMGAEHSQLLPTLLPELFPRSIPFLSCDVGARKPSYLYYRTFLGMYPQFSGCCYVDDRPENIAAGQLFGFRGCCFDIELTTDRTEKQEFLTGISNLVLDR